MLGLLAALLLFDTLLNLLAPADHHLLQTEGGVEELASGNPTTLVIGSSYARSFVPVRTELERRTGVHGDMAIVPDEGGQFIPYLDILSTRLRPLIEEKRADGALVRDRLARVVVVTSYYDLCGLWAGAPRALPAHAWHFGDFLADVEKEGITDFNRNYLRARWNRLWPRSALVQDRGVGRIQGKLRRFMPGREQREAEAVEAARARVEASAAECYDADQRRALDQFLAYLTGRGLEITFVLFPQDTAVVTEVAKATTLRQFAGHLDSLRQHYDFRVVDLSLDHPLEPRDFMLDMDHLNPAGERRFAVWALDGPLAYLAQSREASQ